MSTSANLPAGFTITTISGVRCTAVPKTATTLSNVSTASKAANSNSVSTKSQTAAAAATTSTRQTTFSTSTSTTSTSISSTSISTSITTSSSTSTSTSTDTSTSISTSSSSTSTTSTSTSSFFTSSTSSFSSSIAAAPAVVTAPSVTTAPAAPEAATTTPIVQSQQSINSTPQVTSTELSTTTPASPAPSSTITPATTPIPIALSDTLPSSSVIFSSSDDPTAHTSTSHSSGDGTVHSTASAAAAGAASTSIGATRPTSTADSSSSSSNLSSIQRKAAPVVGGVVGGMAGLAIIAFLIWFFRRRRHQRRRSTLLTPLGNGRDSTFYEIDKQSVGPSSRSTKWKAQAGWQFERVGDTASGIKEKIISLGASLRTKVAGPRSDSPTVNLNRGNSQFIDGQIPQHSRTNSALSNTARTTTKDRFQDWLERFKDNAAVVFKRKRPQEPEDPFATARGMSEKQANLKAGTPDFSQLLNMDDRELQLQADRRRASLTSGSYASSNGLGGLGLDFTSTLDPFADPRDRRNSNPFADPITQPKATVSKENNYIADVRRSRGLSTDMTDRSIGTGISTGAGGWRPPSTAPASRYPSTIAPSRDSYRDTVFSTFSSNVRKGKGRSDPFDLERPELWRRDPVPAMPTNNLTVGDRADAESILVSMERESAVPQPLSYGEPVPRVVSQFPGKHDSAATYESKYSSGVSLGGFGDPGPDVGPGSGASSLQQGYGYLQRSDSATSSVSSRGGVGKAR